MRVQTSRFMLAASVLAMSGAASAASGQEAAAVARAPMLLSLPSQNLGDALDRIAARYATPLDYDKAAIRYFRSSAVVDADSAETAVAQALTGTGLTANRSADGRHIGIGKPDPARLDKDIVVVAHRSQAETSYKADSSDTGTRTGGPSRNLPTSSSVVTAQVLKDEQAQSIDDAVRNVGSVKTALGNVQGVETFQVRGFTANVLTNGVTAPQGAYQPIDAVERVEVLKGPAAILQGEGALGGVVNVVNKKPTSTPLLNLQVQGGSYDEYKVAVDGSTALSPDGHYAARLVASYIGQGRNYGGYDGGHALLINPTLRYKDASLDANIGMTYSDQTTPLQAYTQFTADTHQLVDREGAVGYRNQRFEFQTTSIYGSVEYKIQPWLTAVARSTYSTVYNKFIFFQPFTRVATVSAAPFGFPIPAGQVYGYRGGQRNDTSGFSIDGYLRAKFDTGPLRHTISAGYNRNVQSNDQYNLQATDGLSNYQQVNFLADAPLANTGPLSIVAKSLNHNYFISQGYYFQDLIEFDRFHILGAVRRNLYTTRSNDQYGDNFGYHSAAWTPSAGAVVDITKAISLYGNYTKGFVPSSVRDKLGTLLPPVQSTQFEGGTRIDLNKSKATLTLDGFQITQKNLDQVDQTIPYNFADPRYVLGGGLQSRGIEAELAGQILPGWNVTVSGTRSWYALISQAVPLTGNPYASLVKARGSVFTVYTLRSGTLKGLGFGGGLTAQSSSTATGAYSAVTQTFFAERVPSYIRGDLSLYYRRGPIDVALGVRNVADTRDYSEASTATYVPVLMPRTFRLTLTYHAFGQ